MSAPTDADVATARRVLLDAVDVAVSTPGRTLRELIAAHAEANVAAVAQALADERERCLAPFLAHLRGPAA